MRSDVQLYLWCFTALDVSPRAQRSILLLRIGLLAWCAVCTSTFAWAICTDRLWTALFYLVLACLFAGASRLAHWRFDDDTP